MESLESIDDDCDTRGIHFVKVSEEGAEEEYGVQRLPKLVYFQNSLPSLYEGQYVPLKECIKKDSEMHAAKLDYR